MVLIRRHRRILSCKKPSPSLRKNPARGCSIPDLVSNYSERSLAKPAALFVFAKQLNLRVLRYFVALDQFLTEGLADLSKGPVVIIFAKDPVDVDTTLRHYLSEALPGLAAGAPPSRCPPISSQKFTELTLMFTPKARFSPPSTA